MTKALNKDLEKVEQDARSILAIMPKAGQIKLKVPLRLLFWTLPIIVDRVFKLEPFVLKYRIQLAEQYGEKELIKIFGDPTSLKFLEVHMRVIYNAMSDKGRAAVGAFEDFLKHASSPAKEVEMLLIALELRGLAENPKLTEAELKEVLDGIKKKPVTTPTNG